MSTEEMQTCHPTRKWFSETQSQWFEEHGVPTWFHGFITRNDAENLLKGKPPGCFLVRVGETRIGYSLSYTGFERCRHFKIDVLADGQFTILGETNTHKTLAELVKFHRRNPLLPFNEILTQPCGQKTLPNDYGATFACDKKLMKNDAIFPNNGPSFIPGRPSHQPPVHDIGRKIAPVIPQRITPNEYRPPPPPRAMSCDSFGAKMLPIPSPVPKMRTIPPPPQKMCAIPSPEQQTSNIPPPAQNQGTNKLYPLIPEEMMAAASVQDSTSLKSGLYPWRNKMKHAASLDSLLFDRKPKDIPEISAASREAHHTSSAAALMQAGGGNSQWKHNMHANKPLNPGRKFKNKVLPLIGNAFSTNSDARMPQDSNVTGRETGKEAVPKNTGTDMHSEPAEAKGRKSNMAAEPTTGGSRNKTLLVTAEEYKRPPPFAPGFEDFFNTGGHV